MEIAIGLLVFGGLLDFLSRRKKWRQDLRCRNNFHTWTIWHHWHHLSETDQDLYKRKCTNCNKEEINLLTDEELSD